MFQFTYFLAIFRHILHIILHSILNILHIILHIFWHAMQVFFTHFAHCFTYYTHIINWGNSKQFTNMSNVQDMRDSTIFRSICKLHFLHIILHILDIIWQSLHVFFYILHIFCIPFYIFYMFFCILNANSHSSTGFLQQSTEMLCFWTYDELPRQSLVPVLMRSSRLISLLTWLGTWTSWLKDSILQRQSNLQQ